jgi:hypothetical protein
MNFRYPWIALNNPKLYEAQMAKELLSGHILFGVPVKGLARIDGRDEYLFSLLDDTNRVVVVHLSFSVSVTPEWPWSELYSSLSDWESRHMPSDDPA